MDLGDYALFITYNLMRACTTKECLDRDIDDLAKEYKLTENARERNKLIAAIYCQLYPMMIKISKKYFSITPEQKLECALTNLVKGLTKWDSKKTKFSTFYHLDFANQMKSLYTAENSLKRAVFQNIIDCNEEALNIYSETETDKSYEDNEKELLHDIKNSSFLSSEEKEYCGCVLAGITTTKEIADKLKLEERCKIRKPLVSNPLAVVDLEKQKEQDEKAAQARIKKIKTSIVQKHNLYKSQGINIFRD